MFEEANIEYLNYHGDLSHESRAENMKAFRNDPEYRVFPSYSSLFSNKGFVVFDLYRYCPTGIGYSRRQSCYFVRLSA